MIWTPSEDNSSDLFTKNLPGDAFDKHTAVYCGDEVTPDSQGQGVGRKQEVASLAVTGLQATGSAALADEGSEGPGSRTSCTKSSGLGGAKIGPLNEAEESPAQLPKCSTMLNTVEVDSMSKDLRKKGLGSDAGARPKTSWAVGTAADNQ